VAAPEDPGTLAGVRLTHLDQPVFDGAGATKGDLVRYLDAVHDRMLPELRDRALSVVRARLGQAAFMQKNLPAYAPDWIRTTSVWAHASKREVRYPVCDDRRTLVWLANQRAVEYHPALVPVEGDRQTHLVLDLDPPEEVDPAEGFRMAVAAAVLVRQALDDAGLAGGVKTSGAKGVHVFVPLSEAETPDVAAATRALAARAARLDPGVATTEFVREERDGKVFVDSTRAGGATVVAAYSPRARPGVPVSFPVTWAELEEVRPGELTVLTAAERLASAEGPDAWTAAMASPQALPADLVAEGHAIPIARVVAMHEGKRRKRESHQAEAAGENASSPGGREL
jgi:bifunctional non-homologous end joining protein LigD